MINPEASYEEPPVEKIQVFVQDTLEAHEELIQNKTKQVPDKYFEAKKYGKELYKEAPEDDNREEPEREVNIPHQLLPVVRVTSPESSHSPGLHVTKLVDAEQLETIPLTGPLHVDDLPDLEDVEPENVSEMFSNLMARPRIEVITGDDLKDEGHSVRKVTPFRAENPVCPSVCKLTKDPDSSLIYPEDRDAPNPDAKFQTSELFLKPQCLIEELQNEGGL